jgi:hypothetical protein
MNLRSVLPVVAAGTLAFATLHCGGGDLGPTGGATVTGAGGGSTADTATGAGGTGSSSVVGSAASTGVGGGSGLVPGPVDAVIAQMPPDSWKELPATPMADVCPTPTDHYACGAVMTAWSGGAYDSSRDRLVVFGGGHNDSWFNNVFTFDLAGMAWKRWTDFSNGLTGDTVPDIFRDKRIETCGLYPSGATLTIPDAWLTATGYLMGDKCDDPSIVAQLDPQQPRSVHSYGNVAFSAVTGRFYDLGSVGLFPSGQSGTSRVMGYDFASAAWVRSAANPQPAYGASATDAAGKIWFVSQSNLLQYDPGLDIWKVEPSSATGGYAPGAAVDTKRNVFVVTNDGVAITTYALGQAGAPRTDVTATGFTAPSVSNNLEYLPAIDRFVAWTNQGKSVSFLDPTTWKWTVAMPTGDDPGAGAANGTYGRFRYSSARGVLMLVNTTTTNVFLYKPPTAAP